MSRNVHSITGIGPILNADNIRPDAPLKELELALVSRGVIKETTRDVRDKFNDEMREAARKLGISFGDVEGTTASGSGGGVSSGQHHSVSRSSAAPSAIRSPSPPAPARYRSPPPPERPRSLSPAEDSHVNQSQSTRGHAYAEDSHVNQSQSTRGHAYAEDSHGDRSPSPTGTSSPTSRSPSPAQPSSIHQRTNKPGASLYERTQEQERRAHIDSVMGGTAGFSFEQEKQEDIKCAMLEEIDALITALKEEDADLSRIPKIDQNSAYATVESVLKILRHKSDRSRYCSLASEFLIFGAYALEDLFDGKRVWLGRYQPDLTGWHAHLNVKLRRMKKDTGDLMAGIMYDYNIGPGLRILLELLPSMVLYSKVKKQQHNEPGLFSDEEVARANQNIRDEMG
jgi:hypothetical protein